MANVFTLACGLLGWCALILQLVLQMRTATALGVSPPVALLNYFGYFTILTNILVALALTVPSWWPDSRAARFFSSPMVRTVIAVCIAIVGLVYSLVLRTIWDPQGWQRVADHLLHDVMPPLFLVFWWFSVSKEDWKWRGIARGSLYPLGYLAWSLLRGAFDGRYPYPFVDAGKLGYPKTMVNSLGVMVLFAAVTVTLFGLNRLKPDTSR